MSKLTETKQRPQGWPLAGLKSSFFQGAFTRLEKADEALRTTIMRAVSQGTLGLASGKDITNFDRIWLRETVDPADITFDFDTYVLLPIKAKTLKEGPAAAPSREPTDSVPTTPVIPVPCSPGGDTRPAPPDPPESLSIQWHGELAREQWNLFSLKVLTRLATAEELEIAVQVTATIKDHATLDQLNAALRDLGLSGKFDHD